MRRTGVEPNGNRGRRLLLLAARQPDLRGLLEEAGFAVEAERQPPARMPEVDLAVVFRGRLIGRNQAAKLHERGIPVVEVMTSEPTTPSTGSWPTTRHDVTWPAPPALGQPAST